MGLSVVPTGVPRLGRGGAHVGLDSRVLGREIQLILPIPIVSRPGCPRISHIAIFFRDLVSSARVVNFSREPSA